MEEDHKGCPMIRMGVSGWVFLLVPAYPGCPGPKAVKRLCVCVCVLFFSSAFTVLPSSHGDWIDRLRLSPVGFWRGDGESVSVSQTERRISQSIYWIMSPAAGQLISRRAAPCILDASASQKYLSSRRRYGDIALEIRPSCDASRTSTVLSVQTIRMYLGTLEHLKCRTVKFQHSFIPYCLDHYV